MWLNPNEAVCLRSQILQAQEDPVKYSAVQVIGSQQQGFLLRGSEAIKVTRVEFQSSC